MAFDIEKFFGEEVKKRSEFKDRLYEVTWDFGTNSGFTKDRYVTMRFKRFGDVFKNVTRGEYNGK